jgi:hypothetical protein
MDKYIEFSKIREAQKSAFQANFLFIEEHNHREKPADKQKDRIFWLEKYQAYIKAREFYKKISKPVNL